MQAGNNDHGPVSSKGRAWLHSKKNANENKKKQTSNHIPEVAVYGFFNPQISVTSGYGNLVPVTFEGRVFCICYGLLGVPLILITVTDIGKFLAEHITSTYGSYAQWRRRLRMVARRRNKRRNRTVPVQRSTENGGPSIGLHDALIIEFFTQKLLKKHHSSNIIQLRGIFLENHDQVDDILSPILGDQTITKSNDIGNESGEEQEEDDEDPDHEVVSDPFVVVPTPIILSILVGYMLLGALLISYLESWTFFDGFYFAFISLTTIGFGDYVPENQSYYMFDMLYIFFGLAITTMCIDLVGAQYIEKIHNFGRAIKDARYALINVGGKMVQVRDLMKYSAFLHKKYGLTENRARLLERNSLLVPKSTLTSKYPDAFTPKEIRYIKYIDYMISTENLIASDVVDGTPFSRSRSNSNFTTYSAFATTSSSKA
uniref:Potassium channel domain-containing protein n=1 Tax=Romanomermis culicivorax TaxID=13658 RepID=A0A915IER5_ROMCU